MIEVKECRRGRMLFLSNDEWVGRSFALYGEAFENQINFMLRFIGSDDVVIDGGANMGSMTIPFARKASRVLAFEPQEFIYYILCGNIAINNLYNVTAYMKPLDATTGRLVYFPPVCEFYDQNHHFAAAGALCSPLTEADRELSTLALDSLDLDRVDFIKLDLEGNELLTIQGAQKTIAHFKPIMFVETMPDEVEVVSECLLGVGYIGYVVQTDYFNPDNYAALPVNVLKNHSQDIICWHQDRNEELEPVFQQAVKECDGVVNLFRIDS